MDIVEKARLKYLADKEAGEKISINLSGTIIERIPEWVPDVIDGNFVCYFCPDLFSLKGAPDIVKGDFYCLDCPKLSSPEGMGEVKGKFISDFMSNEKFQQWYAEKMLVQKMKEVLLGTATEDAGDIFSGIE